MAERGMPGVGRIITQGAAPVPQPPKFSSFQWMAKASNEADATGIVTVELGPVPNGVDWTVYLARVKGNSSTPPDIEMFLNSADDLNSVDFGTSVGNNTITTYTEPGLPLSPGDKLIFQWSGMSTGARGIVNALVKVQS